MRIVLFGDDNPVLCRTALHLRKSGFEVFAVCKKRIDRRAKVLRALEGVFASVFNVVKRPEDVPYVYQYPMLRDIQKVGCEVLFANHNEVGDWLKEKQIDIGLLLGTGIIKPHILESVSRGFLNAHSAILPKYRGSKSEFWIMLNKDFEYLGVTVHWVTPGLDQGRILVQKKIFYTEGDTPASLREKTNELKPFLFEEALRMIQAGKGEGVEQDASLASHFGRPKPEDWEKLKAMYKLS